MEDKKKQEMEQKINEQIDKKINTILEQGIQAGNVDFLYKMVDIKKDMAEIKKEEEEMMYRAGGRNYREGGYSEGGYSEGNYGRRGVPGTGRGRYSEGSYGRRGVPGSGRGRYRGEEMMDEMAYHYGNYSESSEYGAEGETMKSLEYMMESVVAFVKMLQEDANSQEEMQLIKRYAKKIGEM